MSETMEEQVVLVNTLDEAQGTMEKMAAHRKGVLHRAFSVFILIPSAPGRLADAPVGAAAS